MTALLLASNCFHHFPCKEDLVVRRDLFYGKIYQKMSDNPILNSPYEEPRLHYAQTADRSLDYEHIEKGRRVFDPKADRQPSPTKQSRQKPIPFAIEPEVEAQEHLINLVRREVSNWRTAHYPETTRVTRELLHFWFANPERENRHKLFFAQQESVETAIWLNEVAEKSNAGQNILNQLRRAQMSVSGNADEQLPRTAFKMATGSGKTVVMACLILYHFANRQEYRSDTRFADYFLVVAPGVTIKDRLGVLYVDTRTVAEHQFEDYYHIRRLIPKSLNDRLQSLNSRLVISNYHTFLPKTLQGNKKSPFDGKVDLAGKKNKTDNKEDYSLVLRRILSDFKTGSRLLILNDEAHHCYLPRGTEKTSDNEEVDENERAAVWFSGLREVAKKYKVHNIYDLSATPYYLNGSGYEPYSLFPWVVSDFGLIEAIESGLVKIPFLPESDTSQELEQPVLANLYEHVKDELPKKGLKKKKKEAKEEGDVLKQERPVIPALIKQALDMFYNHYDEYAKGQRDAAEVARNLFTPPPVFIIVCNNTSVSKEVYKYIAGYEFVDADGEVKVVGGIKDHFNNYDVNNRPKRKPPTLLIDSDALDNSDQINDDFKKVFADEIEVFKRDYTRIHGQGSADNITDAQILREVVNTVGQHQKLGEHIRCVVSVSMLTEGWDANTVTHIMGIRAFGSQLLCEQVAGRALRRMDYTLQGYDQAENPTDSKAKDVVYKFPPEYAHIIGVPFKLFKGGKAGKPSVRVDSTHIKPLPERKADFEITFPNVIGYRIENSADEITCDFSGIESFDIDGTKYPIETTMAVAIAPQQEKLRVKDVLEKRDNELLYLITKELIRHKFSDIDDNPDFRKFGRLKEIVAQWYAEKVRLIGIREDKYKKLLFFQDPKKIVEHIYRGINTHLNTTEFVRPVFNHYNQFGSTRYVNGSTTKPVFETERSHVNYVVEDSTWEAKAAKTLDELKVVSYVKNSFLDFKIPYIKDAVERDYLPDFIIRVKGKDGTPKNLILEVTGMNKDKAEKKWYVENRWLPAVNSVRDRFGYDEWHFIEVKEDIRDISNELIEKIESI